MCLQLVFAVFSFDRGKYRFKIIETAFIIFPVTAKIVKSALPRVEFFFECLNVD